MSIRKKLTALCLALFFYLPVWAVNTAAADADDAFVPVLRFVAASDTHVKDDSDVTAERIGKMMALAYADAQSCEAYSGIDALLIAGDLTNDGTKTEFDKFWAAVDGALKDDTQYIMEEFIDGSIVSYDAIINSRGEPIFETGKPG